MHEIARSNNLVFRVLCIALTIFSTLPSLGAGAEKFEKQFEISRLPHALGHVRKMTGEIDSKELYRFFASVEKMTDVVSLLEIKSSEAANVQFSFGPNIFVQNAYLSKNKTLQIGSQYCPNSAGRLDYLPVAIHELSHSIFAPNIRLHLENQIIEGAGNYDQYFMKVLEGKNSEAEMIPAEIDDLRKPFDELFADLLTVLVLNNPKALSDFFATCTGNQNIRNFAFEYKISGWDAGNLLGLAGHEHDVFNPVRSYLWKKLHSNSKNAASLLRTSVDVSIEMIRELYAKKLTYGEWRKVNQEHLNREFIKRFEMHFRDNKN